LADRKLTQWAHEEKFFQGNPANEGKLAGEVVKLWEKVGWQGAVVPAEIASLARVIPHREIKRGDGSGFLFLCSDTERGKACGRVNLLAFRRIFPLCSCTPDGEGLCKHVAWDYLKDVQHKKPHLFFEGAHTLLPRMERAMQEYAASGAAEPRKLVFNMTGSYKGLIPFATEYCDRLKFEMVYLFEESDALIFKMPDSDDGGFEL
jgi:hypothetical protein